MQNTQPPAQPYDDDEISLIELWQTLARRKALILATMIVCIAGGLAFSLLKAPTFEASVSLRIGQISPAYGGSFNLRIDQKKSDTEIGAAILVENANDLASRLSAQNGAIRAKVQKDSDTIVQLIAEGGTSELATRALQDTVRELLENHKAILDANTRPIAERVSTLTQQRESLIKQYAEINEIFVQLKEHEPAQAALLVLERTPITNAINQHETERLRLSQTLIPPQTRPTELLSEITPPTAPVKPKKALVLALAAVLGMMGGVMLAFVAEFIAKAKANATAKA